jgi:primary-amine oxidase
VGYIFMPGENAIPYADPQSSVRQRAGFLNAQFWVTPYRREERYAAGDYINQNPGGEGLAKWTLADRSVEDTDVVVWYTLGVTHIPRPEDWPVMPVHRAGFQLMPAGFFSRNPALDVPHSPAP